VHSSEPVLFPVVMRYSPILAEPEPGIGTELLIQRMRAVGQEETWVLICDPEHAGTKLLINDPSTRRLTHALATLCEE